MLKKAILICIVALLQFSSVNADDFTTKHIVEYKLQGADETIVNHTIDINVTNTLDGVKTLTFTEPAVVIRGVTKLDKSGYKISSLGNEVQVVFDKAIIGPKNVTVSYSYQTNQIFNKVGSNYTLNIPSIEQTESNIENFELKVYLPNDLTVYNSQVGIKGDKEGNYIILTKEDLSKGETITFGNNMLYKTSIQYVVSPKKNYIVIPPNIKDRQKVYITNLSLKPTSTYIDKNGNYIYTYKVNTDTQITADFIIKTYGNKSKDYIANKDLYTKPIKNWDFTKGVAVNYLKFSQNKSIEQDVKDAMEFNNQYLDYDLGKSNYDYIARIGAENLSQTNKENAVCLEYSDLLIAQLRGLGIAARELSGLAYTKDIDQFSFPFLHSWVDYYNGKEWVMVDPTYNDTSKQDYLYNFDLFHIVFLIRSFDSEYPLLAGSYRSKNYAEKIKINAVDRVEKVQIDIAKLSVMGFSVIKNNSNNIVFKTGPNKAGIYKNSKLKQLQNDEMLNVTYTKLNLLNIADTTIYLVITLFLLSPVLFILLHKSINKRKVKVKSKVNSIV